MSDFQDKLAALLNEYSAENGSDTPDFILAQFLNDCLLAWDKSVSARTRWYKPEPVDIDPPQPA